MSHEPTRLMACERARGGQCIRVAVHRGSPRERRTEMRKILFRPGFLNRVWADTPTVGAARGRVHRRSVKRAERAMCNDAPCVEPISIALSHLRPCESGRQNVRCVHSYISFRHSPCGSRGASPALSPRGFQGLACGERVSGLSLYPTALRDHLWRSEAQGRKVSCSAGAIP